MINAAVVSSFRVFRIRVAGWAGSSSAAPSTCGITATPVSKPDRPRASFGNTTSEMPIITQMFECSVVSMPRQFVTSSGAVITFQSALPITIRFRPRYTTTRTTAIPIASPKPRRNTPASSASRTRVMITSLPSNQCGTYGFSITCAVASAADSVIVMMKSVAMKPSRTRIVNLPFQRPRSRSSIAIEPSPCGLSAATRRYTGSAPSRVRRTRIKVATGDSRPTAAAAIAGW